MKAPIVPQRCAIYTRKSSEHNLDLAFNSLDAQREACEAYIKSQAHEGWRLIPERYDDGGLSGASLDRPALQKLLADVREHRLDVIVVYKVGRLTRSLADFAKLVELFDAHNVSFVSVTQAFNTTSSMGRLTLNVLLSFAQFEREVIGERVRDKIAASKRKGLWVGGPVPLGYRSLAKMLAVVPDEAEVVRAIFRRYLALGSIGLLVEDLAQKGIRPRNAQRFMVGPLAHILKNRFYIGEIVYRGEVHQGEHQPIIEKELFEAVQTKLRDRAVARRLRRSGSLSFLSGLLYDERGNRMSPSHANKRGVRYRYYVSQALLQSRKEQAGTITRVSAPDIEEQVVAALRHRFSDNSTELSEAAGNRDLVLRHVERIVLRPKSIDITLRCGHPQQCNVPASAVGDGPGRPTIAAPNAPAAEHFPAPALPGVMKQSAAETNEPQPLSIPWLSTMAQPRKGVAWEPGGHQLESRGRDVILTAIARARAWMDDLIEGRVGSFEELAKREGKVERHIRFLAPLAFLSPRIVQAIAEGSAHRDLTVTLLSRALSHSWAEQERKLGIATTSSMGVSIIRPMC